MQYQRTVATGLLAVLSAAFLLAAPAAAQFDALANIDVYIDNTPPLTPIPTETDYIPNVVKSENGLASFEALKAQAVAARTFAYYKMNLQGSIGDGTNDQVYSGSGGSPQAIHYQAALATEGEILYVYDNLGPTTGDVLICSFYVAGAIPTGPFDPSDPCAIPNPGDSDPTNTEKWVTYTYEEGLLGGDNTGTPLGFNGTPTNPNWPNRGAKSQNGADFLSDNSISYIDILKYYYGADIQIRTATTEGTGVQFGLKTLVNFDDYGDTRGHTFDGHEGTFHRSPTFSGSTTANVAGSTADRSSAEAHSGTHSQLLDITYDESSGDDFLVRHISGARFACRGSGGNDSAAREDNLQFESIGSVGFWLKTDDPGIEVSIAIDDPNTAERGRFKAVISDDQWHRYEWFLDEDSEWEGWVNGNGQIEQTRVTIDSIQFTGASDAQIYLDDIFWDPTAVYVPPVPGDFDEDGDVDNDDLSLWKSGFGTPTGAAVPDGDADGDGDVDNADLMIWQSNYTGPLSATFPVPEPSGMLLQAMGILAVVFAFRMRCAEKKVRRFALPFSRF